jgi:hypothetical protein
MKAMRLIWAAVVFFATTCFLFASVGRSFAQTSTNNSIPIVTIVATDLHATWSGKTGTFTVFRSGNPTPALNVYCCISGTASNGVDYQSISSFVSLPSGVMSNSVVITPINRGQTNIETVILDLCPSPMMNPVNYATGYPSEAVVYISPASISNLPPIVNIVSPTNGAVYQAPVNIPLLARATDPDWSVTNVEYFAGSTDLGRGQMLVLDPPGINGVVGPVYYLNWTNVQTGKYPLTAIATDNGGASTVSALVNITVGSVSNVPPVVRITSPPNGAVYRAPVNISIFAYAFDVDGNVSTVQFFADGGSLGFGRPVIAVPPPVLPGSGQPPIPIVQPTNYWELLWTNPPPGTNVVLMAEATSSGGISSTSAPVEISILPSLPPPTNRPPSVGIVATDPIAIEGTNCWPWLGLAGSPPAWSNWFAASAVFQLRTNCGPKSATFTVFRVGETNDDLNINYAVGGSATNGIDYVALPGVVLIPAGQQKSSVAVVPLDDGPPDVTSTVILKIAPGTNYVVGRPASAAAIILDSRSPRATTGRLPGGLFQISSTGPEGSWFSVEYSTDLINWTQLCTNQVVNGVVDFVDPDAASQPGRFYQIVPQNGVPMQ